MAYEFSQAEWILENKQDILVGRQIDCIKMPNAQKTRVTIYELVAESTNNRFLGKVSIRCISTGVLTSSHFHLPPGFMKLFLLLELGGLNSYKIVESTILEKIMIHQQLSSWGTTAFYIRWQIFHFSNIFQKSWEERERLSALPRCIEEEEIPSMAEVVSGAPFWTQLHGQAGQEEGEEEGRGAGAKKQLGCLALHLSHRFCT